MYAILILIITILIIEIYSLIPKNQPAIPIKYLTETDIKTNLKFDKYIVNEGTTVLKPPGSILIKENYNVILNYKDENILMEKDIIYNIDVDFEVETININNGNILYYYIGT